MEDKLEFNLDKLLDEENSYHIGSELNRRMDYVTDIMDEIIAPYILKVSGGEIFLIKGVMEYFKKYAKKYKRIQVLTNGTLLNKKLMEELSQIKNLSLQISMDGHTLEMNGYRVINEKTQQKLLQVIELCQENSMNLEINCVLTKKNVEGIYEYVEYLSKYTNMLFLPYPVRGKMKDDFFPDNTQLHGLKRIIKDYDRFRKILPPKAYLVELLNYLDKGVSESGCHIPGIIMQSFDDGEVTACPNIWFRSMGNSLKRADKLKQNIAKPHFYKFIKKNRKYVKECRECFTPWDILNLFFEDKISTEELKEIYLYNDKVIMEFLIKSKEEYKKEWNKLDERTG